MNNEIRLFYAKLFEDTKFKKNLEQKMKNVENERDLKKIIKEDIIPIAQKRGKKFTVDNLIEFEKESMENLSEELLQNVSGGASLKSLGIGLIAASLLGAELNTAHAAVPFEAVKNYQFSLNQGETTQEDYVDTESEEEEALIDEEENGFSIEAESQTFSLPQRTVSVRPPYESFMNLPGRSDAEKLINMVNKSNFNTLVGRNLQSNTVKQKEEGERKFKRTSKEEVDKKDTEEKNIKKKALGQVFDLNYKSPFSVLEKDEEEVLESGEEYIARALNPRDAVAMNISGTTQRFRFYNFYINSIVAGHRGPDGVPMLDYKKFSGDGSANLMTSLFPSSFGNLSTEGGYAKNNPFSKSCEPTPELMADIVSYLYNHVRVVDEAEKININTLEDLNNTVKKANFSDKSAYDDVVACITSTKRKKGKKKYEDLNKKLNVLKLKSIKSDDDFEKIDNLFKNLNELIQNFDKDVVVKGNTLKGVISLLYNAQYMIENQEENGTSENSDRILPKYTTERMIMSYFIEHFNDTNDLDRFYGSVRNKIGSDGSVSDFSVKHDEGMKKLLSKISKVKNCPYNNETFQNGSTKNIQKSEDGKCKYVESTFQDCADTAVRHLLNLLGYSDGNSWNFFFDNKGQIESAKVNANTILTAINENSVLPNLSLKDKLQAFIYYQSECGADNADVVARSFWNFVVSHMDDNIGTDFYDVKYNPKGRVKGNEVNTGFINMMKLTCNLLKGLGKECGKAQKAIDTINLEKKDKGEIQKAIEEVLKVIDDKVKVENIQDLSVKDNEIYGKVTVSLEDKKFVIDQTEGHAHIDFNPLKADKTTDKRDQKFIENDVVAQVLGRTVGIFNSKNSSFCSCYGKEDDYNVGLGQNSQQYKNFKTLKFFRKLQNEGNNLARLKNELKNEHLQSDIDVNYEYPAEHESRKQIKSKDFIFENYVLPHPEVITNCFSKPNLKGGELYDFAKAYNCLGRDNLGNEYMFVRRKNGVRIFPFWEEGNCPEKVIIPSEIIVGEGKGEEHLKVCSINNDSFRWQKDVKEISFAEGFDFLYIGKNAFWNCANLKSVKFPKVGNLIIDNMAFEGCSNLETVELPQGIKNLKISQRAFVSCQNLKRFTINQGAEKIYIGESAFRNCRKLNVFEILQSEADTLTIGEEAFMHCNSLKEFKIFANMTKIDIGKGSLKNIGLETIIFPRKLTELNIGDGAFECNWNLSSVELPLELEILNIGRSAFLGCPKKEFIIPESVNSLTLGGRAFGRCRNLESIKVKAKKLDKLEIGEDVAWLSGYGDTRESNDYVTTGKSKDGCKFLISPELREQFIKFVPESQIEILQAEREVPTLPVDGETVNSQLEGEKPTLPAEEESLENK